MSARTVDNRLLAHGRTALPMVVAAVALGTVGALLILTQAVLLAAVISGVFLDREQLGAVSGDLILLAIVFGARAITGWGTQILAGRIGATAKRSVRRELIAAVLRRGTPAPAEGGRLTVQIIQGVDALDSYFSRYLPQLLLAALVPLVGIIWVATIDGLSAVILLVTVPLIPVFMTLIGNVADQQTARRWSRLQELAGAFQEMVRGMLVLRVFNRTSEWLARLEQSSDHLRRETMATLRIAFLSALVLELVATLSTALVAVAVGLRVVYGQVSFESALAVLIIAPEIYLPLRGMGSEFHAAMNGVKASESAFALIDDSVRSGGHVAAPDLETASIVLDHVAVTAEDRDLVSGLSLRIEPGEFIAVVGASGVGKTTLLRLLMGFSKPTSGTIHVGGVDLEEIERRSWWNQISYLPQDPFIRMGTIRDNLLVANPSAREPELSEALRAADLDHFVASLPLGLDTQIGERGKLLSSGERRRLGLARTLVRGSPLVLLDEPTANVDAETRDRIAASLAGFRGTATMIAVVHDRALARRADRCVELVER